MYPFFFFNDTATTEIYTLSLHDALPISPPLRVEICSVIGYSGQGVVNLVVDDGSFFAQVFNRSEEHTSELQSQSNLVCRLLLEKKKTIATTTRLLAVATCEKLVATYLMP